MKKKQRRRWAQSDARAWRGRCRAGTGWGVLLCLVLPLVACRAESNQVSVTGTSPPVSDVVLRPGFAINLSVLVAGKKEIEEPAKRIMDNGSLTLPLLGKVRVAGLTLDQLQGGLANKYSHYFVNPQVIVDFVQVGEGTDASPWGYVTVLGRVKEPGRIAVPATRDMTVSRAIQIAGGFASSARDNAILITRVSPDGQVKTRSINLRAVGSAGRLEEDIALEANDVVFVPESTF